MFGKFRICRLALEMRHVLEMHVLVQVVFVNPLADHARPLS
jgi:hypothetical protein